MGSGSELMQTDSHSNPTVDKGGGYAGAHNVITGSEALKQLKVMFKDNPKLLKKVMSLAESLVENGCRYVGEGSSKGLSKSSGKATGNPEKSVRSRG